MRARWTAWTPCLRAEPRMTATDEHARLIGNPGAASPPRSRLPSAERVYQFCVVGWVLFACVSFVVSWMLSAFGTEALIELCPPLEVTNSTTIALNASSTCRPTIDARRLQDVMKAKQLGFLESDTNGITCDVAWQDRTQKFNDSCTLVDVMICRDHTQDEGEDAYGLRLSDRNAPSSVRIDAIVWSSLGREQTLAHNVFLLGLLACVLLCLPLCCHAMEGSSERQFYTGFP